MVDTIELITRSQIEIAARHCDARVIWRLNKSATFYLNIGYNVVYE